MHSDPVDVMHCHESRIRLVRSRRFRDGYRLDAGEFTPCGAVKHEGAVQKVAVSKNMRFIATTEQDSADVRDVHELDAIGWATLFHPQSDIDNPWGVASLLLERGARHHIFSAITVPDVARTLDWYASIGFQEITRYTDDGLVNFGMVSFGKAELMLNMHGKPGPHDVSLWFHTDQVDSLYQLLKSRQLEAAQAVLADPSPQVRQRRRVGTGPAQAA